VGDGDETGGGEIRHVVAGCPGLLTFCWESFLWFRESIDVPGTIFLQRFTKLFIHATKGISSARGTTGIALDFL
jgi:hypothetical protein